jgi:Icc-related predicted phosphoesterase
MRDDDMKIFATSDIHGNKTIMNKLFDAYENSEAELLLVCGDIGG